MDALILAAGFGSRMGDLTEKIPKPLLNVNQKPLITYALELIESLSLDNIYVNTHYQANILQKFLKQNYPHIKISHEVNILGTGGGIKKIQNQDILILNTDNLWQPEFNKEIKSSIYSFSCLVSSRIREIFKSKANMFEFIALQNDV